MQHLGELVEFLLDLNLFAAEQLDSFTDNVIVKPSGKWVRRDDKIVVAELEYQVAIDIERYPHGEKSAYWLFAQVSAWIMSRPDIRIEPFEVNFVVDVLDNKTADIEFRMTLKEDIIAVPDANGELIVNGQGYTLP